MSPETDLLTRLDHELGGHAGVVRWHWRQTG
jgi:hypothetical protein